MSEGNDGVQNVEREKSYRVVLTGRIEDQDLTVEHLTCFKMGKNIYQGIFFHS